MTLSPTLQEVAPAGAPLLPYLLTLAFLALGLGFLALRLREAQPATVRSFLLGLLPLTLGSLLFLGAAWGSEAPPKQQALLPQEAVTKLIPSRYMATVEGVTPAGEVKLVEAATEKKLTCTVASQAYRLTYSPEEKAYLLPPGEAPSWLTLGLLCGGKPYDPVR